MSSSVGSKVVTGKVTATGAVIDIKTVGFTPSIVKVQNQDNQCSIEYNDQMADDSAIKIVAAGTRTNVASDGITPLTGQYPGFSIGALADINDTTTEELTYEATE